MSDGLIGDLSIYYPAGVEMEGEADPESEWYSGSELLALLRSERTVKRLAAEHCQHQGIGKSCWECREIAADMLSILAGEPTEEDAE